MWRDETLRSYCDFSVWPYDLEHCVTCCARLWDKFDLRQLIRAWIIAFYDAGTLCQAVTSTFDLLTLKVHYSEREGEFTYDKMKIYRYIQSCRRRLTHQRDRQTDRRTESLLANGRLTTRAIAECWPTKESLMSHSTHNRLSESRQHWLVYLNINLSSVIQIEQTSVFLQTILLRCTIENTPTLIYNT